jgi:hypothetical protein
MEEKEKEFTYTCNEYREEMILVNLHKRLQQEGLSEEDRRNIQKEIERLEKQMGL